MKVANNKKTVLFLILAIITIIALYYLYFHQKSKKSALIFDGLSGAEVSLYLSQYLGKCLYYKGTPPERLANKKLSPRTDYIQRPKEERRVFIDLGANDGDSTKYFLDTHPEARKFELYLFEPNTKLGPMLRELRDQYKETRFHLIHAAMWTSNGTLSFNRRSNSKTSYITDAVKNADDPSIKAVPAIDIVWWMNTYLSPSDYVIMKMDIECAEYRVLQLMFETGIIGMIDKIYVEFHKKTTYRRTDCSPDQTHVDALIGSMYRCGVTAVAWPFRQDFLDLPRI